MDKPLAFANTPVCELQAFLRTDRGGPAAAKRSVRSGKGCRAGGFNGLKRILGDSLQHLNGDSGGI